MSSAASFEGTLIGLDAALLETLKVVAREDGASGELVAPVSADGGFSLDALLPGRYRLSLRLGPRPALFDGRTLSGTPPDRPFAALELAGHQVESFSVEQHLPGSFEVEVRLDGAPVEGALVTARIEPTGDLPPLAGAVHGVTDANGIARLFDLWPGVWSVRAYGAQHAWCTTGTQQVHLEPGDAGFLMLPLTRHEATLRVLDGAGRPWAGSFLIQPRERCGAEIRFATDEMGRAMLALLPGEHDITPSTALPSASTARLSWPPPTGELRVQLGD